MTEFTQILQEPVIVEAPAQIVLRDGGNRGCLRLFGFFFLLPGLCLIALVAGIIKSTPPIDPGTAQGAVLFLMGVLFTAVGGWMSFYNTYTLFDSRTQQVQFHGGWMFLRARVRSEPIASFESIVLTMHEETDDSGNTHYFQLSLERSDGTLQGIARSDRLTAMMLLALTLHRRFNVEVVDRTMSSPRHLSVTDMERSSHEEKEILTALPQAELDALNFREELVVGSLSRLYRAEYKGGTVFKIMYPKHFGMRLFMIATCFTFFGCTMGWDISSKLQWVTQTDFQHPSVETVFGGGMLFLFMLFLLVFPVAGLIKEFICPNRRAIIYVRQDNVMIDDMAPQTRNGRYYVQVMTIKRADIQGVDIKVAAPNTWKIARVNNMLVIRVPHGVIRTAYGLEAAQLDMIKQAIT